MKNIIFILFGFLTLISCSLDNDNDSIESCTKSEETYNNDNGTLIELTQQQWYLKRNEIGGGSINLRISGYTNGDRATIRIYGDGEFSDVLIDLDSDNKFEKDIEISFTATSVPNEDIIEETRIMVFKDMDTLQFELESCVLRY